jgi:hypothetical protein
LPAIKESVPVFEGKFRITEDVKVNSGSEFLGPLGKEGKVFTLSGKLEYQACDQTKCYMPTSVPLKWQLQVFPLDRRGPRRIFGTSRALKLRGASPKLIPAVSEHYEALAHSTKMFLGDHR